ncbi:TPA_asm: hypothetical protein GHP51_14430, partial [Listeria monocytogenes]|nr:hypothetical protein [Listeria monocytogenes]
GVLIPIETLAYISEKIQHASSIVYQASQEEFEEKKRNNRVDDPIIEILCSLSNSDKYNDAGILLMEYLKKRQDKVYEIFSAIKSNFDIEEDWNSYLEKRFSMFEIFSSQENINELTSLLIVNIAEKFLKFSDERYVSNDQGVVIRQYTLVDGDYLIKLHTKILYMLFKVYELNYLQVNNHIDKLLYNYPVYEAENGFLETISSDLKCIETLFFKDLKGLNIRQEAIVSKLNSEAKKIKLESQLFFEYEPSSKQVIYKVFSPNRLEGGFDYEKIQEIKVKKLTETFNNNTNDLLGLFDVLAEYQSDELLNIYEL